MFYKVRRSDFYLNSNVLATKIGLPIFLLCHSQKESRLNGDDGSWTKELEKYKRPSILLEQLSIQFNYAAYNNKKSKVKWSIEQV